MASACLSTTKPTHIGTRFIDKHFGRANDPIGHYLRKQLLTVVSDHYTFGDEGSKTKSYVLNYEGFKFVSSLIGIEPINDTKKEYNLFANALEWAKQTYEDELNGEIKYEEKSNRYWHPIQNIKSAVRDDLLASNGFQFTYDIQNAAPSILYQFSRQIPTKFDNKGKQIQGPNTEVLETIEYYLKNKTHIRNQLAKEANIEVAVIKRIITSLFAGAKLSANKHTAIWDLVDGDEAVIYFLMQHDFVIALRKDIEVMWDYIKPVIPFRQAVDGNKQPIFNKDGSRRKSPINSRDKWSIYFEQEKRVVDEIKQYLDLVGVRYFLVHDGFYTNKPVPFGIEDMTKWIEAGTNYVLDFDTGKDYYGGPFVPPVFDVSTPALLRKPPSDTSTHSSWFSGIDWKIPEALTKEEFIMKYNS